MLGGVLFWEERLVKESKRYAHSFFTVWRYGFFTYTSTNFLYILKYQIEHLDL